MQATIPFIILFLYSATNIAEAWLEQVVIELKDPRLKNYHDLNQKEHNRSLVFAVLVAIPFVLIACYYSLYWMLPAIAVNRRIFFDFFLKLFRKRPTWKIEGKGPFDNFFKKIYGEKGGWYELATEVVITIASIVLTMHYHG